MKIGILGGTFNPPHYGHLLIAEQAREACQLDEVWFVPTKIPPHKSSAGQCKDEDRIKMVQLAIADHPSFQLSLIEFERTAPSYTIDTIKKLKEQFPEHTFYFIIGGDMIDYLPKWKEIDDLIKLTKFIGIKRPGYQSTSKYDNDIIHIPAPQLQISSSNIRIKIEQKESVRYLLPEAVIQYIEENGIYGNK